MTVPPPGAGSAATVPPWQSDDLVDDGEAEAGARGRAG